THSLDGEEVAKSWLNEAGMSRPGLSGVLIDEFGGAPLANYRAWADGMRRVASDPRSAGKTIFPYCSTLPDYAQARDFVSAVMETGNRFAWEVYLGEEPTRRRAEAAIDSELRRGIIRWQALAPGVNRRMVIALGFMSAPPETLDRCPSADYKVFMDVQWNVIANAPEFEDLFGVLEYTSAYADEEIVRWTAQLYRHYCIEGRRDMLSTDPYELAHLRNGDFADAGAGWEVSAAEEGAVTFSSETGFGWTQGRYPAGPAGNTFLCARRCAGAANVFSQTIRDLAPGRLYSLKMYSADLDHRSEPGLHVVSVELGGVELLPEKSVQLDFAGCHSGSTNPPRMNFHRRVFRARKDAAELSVSDWLRPADPGGPVGQRLAFNFIQVGPYLEE
ncbi:MAG: hypothetical protein V2A58_03790, partial [Planctomycetota bacterium]